MRRRQRWQERAGGKPEHRSLTQDRVPGICRLARPACVAGNHSGVTNDQQGLDGRQISWAFMACASGLTNIVDPSGYLKSGQSRGTPATTFIEHILKESG